MLALLPFTTLVTGDGVWLKTKPAENTATLSTAGTDVPEASPVHLNGRDDGRSEPLMDWARVLADVTGTVDQELRTVRARIPKSLRQVG